MKTIYSNLVDFQTTDKEIVFHFKSFFGNRPGQTPPPDLEPDVRVVMHISALKKLADVFSQALSQRDQEVREIEASEGGNGKGEK